jgi:hypothetical protein
MTEIPYQTRQNAREILHRIWPHLDRTDPDAMAAAVEAFAGFLAGLDFAAYIGAMAHRGNTDAAVVHWLTAEAAEAQVHTLGDVHALTADRSAQVKAGREALYARWQLPGSTLAQRIDAGPAALRELLAVSEDRTG